MGKSQVCFMLLLFIFSFFNNLNIIMILTHRDLMVCAPNIKALNLRALRFELELKQIFMNFFYHSYFSVNDL